jgi:hypothetical protein
VTRDGTLAAFGFPPDASKKERLVGGVSRLLALSLFEDQEALFEERPDGWRQRYGEVRRFVEEEVAAGRIPRGDLDVSCIGAGERFGELVSNEQAMVLHEREAERFRRRYPGTHLDGPVPDLSPDAIEKTIRRQPELREGYLDWVARQRRAAIGHAVYEAVNSALWLDGQADNGKPEPRPVVSNAQRWAGTA